MNQDDALHLLDRIAKGDEAAFNRLHHTYARRIYAYAMRHLGDHARAEEVAADSLYEVWRAPTRFRGDSALATWLIGIARHKILMAWRAQRADATHDHDDLETVAETHAHDDGCAFDHLAREQRREAITQCIERLPETQRQCVQLVFFQGCTLAEVASVQGVPEGTVKTRLFHARRKLEASLAGWLDHADELKRGIALAAG